MAFDASAAKADLQKQIDKMKADFEKRGQETHGKLIKTIGSCCRLVENTAKLKMKNAVIDYTKSVKRGKGRYHNPSVPGSAPAPDSGNMMRSVTHDVQETDGGVVGRVGSTQLDPPYPAYLENGTADVAERPWLLPSLEENHAEIMSRLGKVTQGGSASMEEFNDDAGD
jgi:hypothetical protein